MCACVWIAPIWTGAHTMFWRTYALLPALFGFSTRRTSNMEYIISFDAMNTFMWPTREWEEMWFTLRKHVLPSLYQCVCARYHLMLFNSLFPSLSHSSSAIYTHTYIVSFFRLMMKSQHTNHLQSLSTWTHLFCALRFFIFYVNIKCNIFIYICWYKRISLASESMPMDVYISLGVWVCLCSLYNVWAHSEFALSSQPRFLLFSVLPSVSESDWIGLLCCWKRTTFTLSQRIK